MLVTFRRLGSFGRLGNQLFQIATTIGIAERNGMDYAFPRWGFNSYFARPLPALHDPQQRFEEYCEESFAYRPILLREATDLKGYFQSERYFSHCEELVRNYFAFDPSFVDRCLASHGALLDEYCCSLHVRRGDYVNHPCFEDLAATDYYEAAIDSMPPSTRYLVFSDDIAFCRQRFRGDRFWFVETKNAVSDLLLMSRCTMHIIANSSFSWWGAWLDPNPEKLVIAPIRWFMGRTADSKATFKSGPPHVGYHDTSDLAPKNWIRR